MINSTLEDKETDRQVNDLELRSIKLFNDAVILENKRLIEQIEGLLLNVGHSHCPVSGKGTKDSYWLGYKSALLDVIERLSIELQRR